MKRIFFVTLLVSLLAAPATGQQAHAVSDSERALLARLRNVNTWLGMLAGEADRSVIVGLVMIPVEGIDLRSGDVVQSLNGTPMTRLDVLLREYAAVPVGERIRLAVRRGDRSVTLAFDKPHPSKVPQLSVQGGRLDGGASDGSRP
jgi:S1-C subfamily serine protease